MIGSSSSSSSADDMLAEEARIRCVRTALSTKRKKKKAKKQASGQSKRKWEKIRRAHIACIQPLPNPSFISRLGSTFHNACAKGPRNWEGRASDSDADVLRLLVGYEDVCRYACM